jgi:3-deoxy-D-manno-octulosonate 8-phosphate phosphatase (KDO 8-P phosphatase)
LRKPLPAPSAVHTMVFDFDGVFTDNKVWIDQNGIESVRCDRGDGLAIDLIRTWHRKFTLDTDIFILSKEANPVVLMRARKLGLPCHQGVTNKLAFLDEHLRQRNSGATPFAGLIYLGNDLNDLPVMLRAGYAVAPADAHPRIKEIAHLVLAQKGGHGFVRAFVEQWLGIDQFTLEELDELISYR